MPINLDDEMERTTIPDERSLSHQAEKAIQSASRYAAKTMRPSGHWYGELKSKPSITAEYVLLLQALGLRDNNRSDEEPIARYLLSQQNNDGSWGTAPNYPGDASTTTEVYLALKVMGYNTSNSLPMRKAQVWMTTSSDGGVQNVQVFTRFYLAIFGLLPWSGMPELPPELIFLPSWSPINIYNLASWARSTIVPMLVICHHRPIFALPNGRSGNNDFLDEIWKRPGRKNVPLGQSWSSYILEGDLVAGGFAFADRMIALFGGGRSFNPFRRLAIEQCIEWIKIHQEPTGDWAGIWPPMAMGILSYKLEGYSLDSSPIRQALEAIERFAWVDEHGKRIQACVSPVWDTVLMCIALADIPGQDASSEDASNARTMRKKALCWVRDRQIYSHHGDWRIYHPKVTPGSFSFEYHNSWYPDVDDTAAAVIAFLKDDPSSVTSHRVLDAAKWILGMQCSNGGWAAFDVDNDKLFLNKIPFSDMDSLCDPPTADIVGRVLEAFGLLLHSAQTTGEGVNMRSCLNKIQVACRRGVGFLSRTQEIHGGWYGRWGVNYIYGTSNVLAGLAYHCFPDDEQEATFEKADGYPSSSPLLPMIRPALRFLTSIQNSDGGWGEALSSYRFSPVTNENLAEVRKACSASSMPSQTAWALLGLIPYLSPENPVIQAGMRYLLEHQNSSDLSSATTEAPSNDQDPDQPALTWASSAYTGTGFPNHFYIGYSLYNHYFPMMAIREYLRACEQQAAGIKVNIFFD